MATVMRCSNPGRLQVLRDQGTINAIDYLIVVDGVDVPGGLRQRLLLVRLLLAVGVGTLDGDNVEIVGGVRVVDPAVRWARRLSDVDPATVDPVLTAAERAHLQALVAAAGDGDQWLAVAVEQPGDHSAYTLRLRDGAGPPAGFDQILSEVAFSFKVACPSPFDCFEEETCPAAVVDEPELDYLARDFTSFRRLMFDRLALVNPTDTSREPAALRTALVETLAYAADELAYFQDAVATEAYLATARTRPSVRRHARLLDYPMHEGCNARAFVQLSLADGTEVSGAPVRAGARVLSRLPWGGATLAPGELDRALSEGPLVFEVLAAPEAFSGDNDEVALYTWGDGDCCLPKGATTATLVDPGGLRLAAGDFLVLEQTRSPDTGLEADADPGARHVVRLVEVGNAVEDLLFPATFVRPVSWHAEDALPFAFPVSEGDQAVAVARGNLVLADHGLTVEEAIELRPWGNQGGLRATLARTNLSWRQPLEGTESAAACLAQVPGEARPRVELTGEGERWAAVGDLLSSPASAREFVVEMESDGRARLRFGDDRMARRPADVGGFSATYRLGNGAGGNVGAESLAHLVADPFFVDATLSAALEEVRNPLPARGGQAAEPIDAVKLYAPRGFRRQERAVTEADWVEVTERHVRVQRAMATLRWTGSWHTAYVTVDPLAGTPFEELRADLEDWLQPYRLAGYDLEVVAPTYVPLDIALTACVDDHHFPDEVERALRTEFSTGVLPDGRNGFFHPDQFTFGGSVWLSQIVARAMAVTGVVFVDVTNTRHDNRFKRWGRPQGTEIDDGRIRIDSLEIARCDNDADAADNGRIAFFMEGGA